MPVVPELNTNSASASADRCARTRRRPGVTGSSSVQHRHQTRRAPGGRRRRATAWSPRARARLRSRRHAGLSRTAAAPSRQMARSAIDELGPVRRHQRHPVACAHAPMLERRGHAVGQRVELRQACIRARRRRGRPARSRQLTRPSGPLREPAENTLSYSENSILVEAESQWRKETRRDDRRGDRDDPARPAEGSVPRVENETLLEARGAPGLSPPFSCEAGNCGTCMAKTDRGQGDHAGQRRAG